MLRFLALLLAMIVLYSIAFHFLMAAEGQQHSWLTGLYWTLTVMSTLGFGDITFQSDAGRVFSMLVLLSGVIFLLVVLPFTFIQFFYAPWLEAQSHMRVSRTPGGHPGPCDHHSLRARNDEPDLAIDCVRASLRAAGG